MQGIVASTVDLEDGGPENWFRIAFNPRRGQTSPFNSGSAQLMVEST